MSDCLDSWAVLVRLDGEQPAAEVAQLSLDRGRPAISWINLIEVDHLARCCSRRGRKRRDARHVAKAGMQPSREVKAFTTMRTWEQGFEVVEQNGGQVTAFFVKGSGRPVRLQAQLRSSCEVATRAWHGQQAAWRAGDKFTEHRCLGLPGVTVLANPGSADADRDLESLLVALYGDLIADSNFGATGIRIRPDRWIRRWHVRVSWSLRRAEPAHRPHAGRGQRKLSGSTRHGFPTRSNGR